MKKIFVPTDLSISSLNVIHAIVARFDEPVEIVLFHAVYIPNSITDLLFITKRINQTYITKDYSDACEILRNKYNSQINTLRTVFFYGSTSMAFNNFIEANAPHCIVTHEHHQYKETYKYSIDPMPLIRKARCPVLSLSLERAPSQKVSEQASLSELLLSAY
jgi:hypothetical protein